MTAPRPTPRPTPRPAPVVEQVRPGLWQIPVVVPNSPLRYTLVYALELGEGLLLVDAGWDAPESQAALEEGLSGIGGGVADVRGVVVTHHHHDHLGLARWVRERSGAWVGMHPAEAAIIQGGEPAVGAFVESMARWLGEAGAPQSEVERLAQDVGLVRRSLASGPIDRFIEDDELIDAPGWDLRALHTPGHTPGHLCLHSSTADVLLAGDHLLPRITPNVSRHHATQANPLRDYLRSLDRLVRCGQPLVLPAHEWRFDDLEGRIDELREHHALRARRIETLVGEGATTVWEIAERSDWARPWHTLSGLPRRSALAETHAHLAYLAWEGRVQERTGRPTRWLPAATSAGRERCR